MQDLPRIADAIASGEIARAPALVDLIAQAQGKRRHLSPHRPGLARRRAFAPGPCGGAGEDRRRRRRAGPGSRPDRRPRYAAAVRRRRPQAGSSPRCRRRCGSPRWSAATTPWIATSAGSGSRRRTTPWSTPTGRAFPTRRPRSRMPTRKQQFDEFILPSVIGDYRGMRDGDGVLCFNFRADRAREILGAMLDPDFTGFPRPRIVRFAGAVGMAQYSDELDRLMADDLPAADLPEHPRRGGRGRGPHAAPHGGDREVSARHLLPQRRPRGALSPARIASWCRRPRSRPTTCSPRCRRPS